jgi:hypothetical protein
VDVRIYYQKIRDVEAKIPQSSVKVISLQTPDGGKAGLITEVPRRVAAKMVVDGTAKIAADNTEDRSRED